MIHDTLIDFVKLLSKVLILFHDSHEKIVKKNPFTVLVSQDQPSATTVSPLGGKMSEVAPVDTFT